MLRQKLDLYVAIKANNLLLVSEALHKFNLQENEFFDDKLSFISWAVLNECSPLVIEKLIEHGADPNRISFLAYIWPTERQIFNSFEPALITATRHKNIKLCSVLLKRGAKINKSDSFSMTALHWASSLNFTEIVEMLFEYNANVNLMDLNNETPLQKAILNGHKGVVEVYAKNCKLESKCREYFQAAIDSSDIDIFRILLDNIKSGHVDFDLNFIDESVGSLLHYAVILCNVQNNLNKLNLKELLDSPISKVKIIELLIEFGAEINSINKLGETPLHMCRNIDVARLLLEKGALMNLTEVTGKIPLYSFLLRENYDICIEMIQNGCVIDTTDRFNNSFFNTIIKSNAPVELILLLLEAGVTLKEDWITKKQYPNNLLKNRPELIKAIEWRTHNPLSLKQMSRGALRKHLNKINSSKSIVGSVNQLEKMLPRSLHNYILLNLNELEFKNVICL